MNHLHVESLYEEMLNKLRRVNDPIISTIIDFSSSLNITTETLTDLQISLKSMILPKYLTTA